MSATNSFNVRVWKTRVYKGTRGTTYTVRWAVDGREFTEPFRNKTQSESFRSVLLSAARNGEAFSNHTGRPLSMRRQDFSTTWYQLTCDYVDRKWPRLAASTRRTVAEALTAATMFMIISDGRQQDGARTRAALNRWGFNTLRRDAADKPEWVADTLRWVANHTRPAADLEDPDILRNLLDGIAHRLDGTVRSATATSRWRKIISNLAEYAVERDVLTENPVSTAARKAPQRTSMVVDRRRVVNPTQAWALLGAVASQGATGERLHAYFGCLYYAALRPEEGAALTEDQLDLPAEGWGWLHLAGAKPHVGREWTDSGEARDNRPLKQRAVGETRPVPSPPELTALLRRHLDEFGTTSDGRLFVGERATHHLPAFTVNRAWARARAAVFGDRARSLPIAARPYDLRHAAVSTWLNSGIGPTQVAEWAGHSVDVLLKIYAKCIDGDLDSNRRRIEAALARRQPSRAPGKTSPRIDREHP
ncbi:tyrosine-type recombinase/integrase [Microlunatus speluncae]|uniref:tyrosine-type recombinase/integrase n=1 Tax=Microlunatus speluncae TaxID=2594267 RepID=UPI0012662155|nr:tyrosine-type recombinase/integrase [Microlunatus speluncae]